MGQTLDCAPYRNMMAAAVPPDSSVVKQAVSLNFSPDGKTLANSGANGRVKQWDVSRIVGPKTRRP
jgi:hypothetical protein